MKIFALIISIFSFTVTPILNSGESELTLTELAIKPEIGNNKTFVRFLRHFDKVEIPDDIDHAKIQEYKSKYMGSQRNLTARNSDVQRDVRNYIIDPSAIIFSRMGPPLVIPMDRFYLDENTLAVTYLVRQNYDFFGFKILMSLYDLEGNEILDVTNSKENLETLAMQVGLNKSKSKKNNSIVIAGFDSVNTILCSFNSQNNLNVDSYKNNWTKDVKEFGVISNTIANYERLKTEAVTINADGRVDIKKVEPSFAGLK